MQSSFLQFGRRRDQVFAPRRPRGLPAVVVAIVAALPHLAPATATAALREILAAPAAVMSLTTHRASLGARDL